jgi:hypothetical protein
MKIKLRNLASVDVSQTDDRSGIALRFVTHSGHEAIAVIPYGLVQGLAARLIVLSSEVNGTVKDSKNEDSKNATEEFSTQGATRAA